MRNIEEGPEEEKSVAEHPAQQKRKKKRPQTAKAPAGPGGMRVAKSKKQDNRPPSARAHKPEKAQQAKTAEVRWQQQQLQEKR